MGFATAWQDTLVSHVNKVKTLLHDLCNFPYTYAEDDNVTTAFQDSVGSMHPYTYAEDDNVTTAFQDTVGSTKVTPHVDIPDYGIVLLSVGISLIVVVAILIVPLTVGCWAAKKAQRRKIQPEFSMAKDFL